MSKLIDYKISRIINNDSGTTVVYRVYEGEFKDVADEEGNMVNQYVRGVMLGKKEVKLGKNSKQSTIESNLNKKLETELVEVNKKYPKVSDKRSVIEEQK